jgi:hemolysin activation/secretion protein
VDVGTGWNERSPDPDPAVLLGMGLGLRFLLDNRLSLRLDYGISLRGQGYRLEIEILS